jgi:hypothetical protein
VLVDAAPLTPADGDIYICGNSGGTLSTGHAFEVARYRAATTSWEYYVPKKGWKFWENLTGATWIYDGAQWAGTFSISNLSASVVTASSYVNATEIRTSNSQRISSGGVGSFTGFSSTGGGTFTGGKVTFAPAAAGYASLNIPTRSAPVSAPAVGDVESDGTYARFNGLGLYANGHLTRGGKVPVTADGDYVLVTSTRLSGIVHVAWEASNRVVRTTLAISAVSFNSGADSITLLQHTDYAGGTALSYYIKYSADNTSASLILTLGNRNGGTGDITVTTSGIDSQSFGASMPTGTVSATLSPGTKQLITSGLIRHTGRICAYAAKTSAYTLIPFDDVIGVSGATPFTVTLPSVGVIGTVFTIKRTDANTATITITAGGTTTIDGATTTTMTTAYQVLRVIAISATAYAII